jgi:streptogramin lyase
MTLDGTVTRDYRLPSGGPDVIAPGPDGALWFTQGSIGQVGRLKIKRPRVLDGYGPQADRHTGR